MCSGGEPRMRNVGDAFKANWSGDLEEYHRLRGADGDTYRARLASMGPRIDTLARTGIFDLQGVAGRSSNESMRRSIADFRGFSPIPVFDRGGSVYDRSTVPEANYFNPRIR